MLFILFYVRFYHCTAYAVYFHWLHVCLLDVTLNINQSINQCSLTCHRPEVLCNLRKRRHNETNSQKLWTQMTGTSWCATSMRELINWNSCSTVHVFSCCMVYALRCCISIRSIRISDWLSVRLLIFIHSCAGGSAGFWLGGSITNAPLPPEANKFLKIWLRNGAFWSISE